MRPRPSHEQIGHVVQWLIDDVYPRLLEEPFDWAGGRALAFVQAGRAVDAWVWGPQGFIAMWQDGVHASDAPAVRLENVKHRLFERIWAAKQSSTPGPTPDPSGRPLPAFAGPLRLT